MLTLKGFGQRSLKRVARNSIKLRTFWHSDDHNVGSAAQQAQRSIVSVNSADGSEEKGLMFNNGDFSPSPGTIITLGTNKRPIFPGYLSSLILKDEQVIEAVRKNKEKEGGYLGVFLRTEDMSSNVPMPEIVTKESEIFKVGTFAQVQQINKTDFGTQLILMGHRRINFESFVNFGPPAIANVSHWKRPTDVDDALTNISMKAHINEVTAAGE